MGGALEGDRPARQQDLLDVQPDNGNIRGSLSELLQSRRWSLGVEASVAPVHDMHEVESLVSASNPNSGLVVIPDAFTIGHSAEITLLAGRYGVPAVSWSRSFAELGGLISYGPDLVDEYRRAASYADRILRGETPSELPVQTPVKFELVINMKTVKALGLTVPDRLRALADEVIE